MTTLMVTFVMSKTQFKYNTYQFALDLILETEYG